MSIRKKKYSSYISCVVIPFVIKLINKLNKKKKLVSNFEKISNKIKECEKKKSDIKKKIDAYDELSAVFFNDRIIDIIPNYTFFLNTLIYFVRPNGISYKTASFIFGKSISFANSHSDKINNSLKADIISRIATFYNENGGFIDTLESKTLNELIDLLLKNEETYESDYANFGNNTISLRELALKFQENYITFLRSDMYIHKNPDLELKNYYNNGVIICIPDDITSFVNIVNQASISEDEKRYILNTVSKMKLDKSFNDELTKVVERKRVK